MSYDIVDRLLARKHWGSEHGQRGQSYWGPHDPLCKEAAEEIIRLRKMIAIYPIKKATVDEDRAAR